MHPDAVQLFRPHRVLATTLGVLAGLFLYVGTAGGAEKVALLIGNNNYAVAPLRNAVNDARDLSESLKELGFTVILRENASRQEMIGAIREFGTQLDGALVAMFFYAGHAMQFKDRNYLIPTDADMKSEDDVTFSSVEVSQIFDRMERARTRFNFIVLDACRDNPFASAFKVSSAGLAQIGNAPSGTLVAYATAPGSVAADGFGRNGVYTKHILQQIKVPDLPVEIMFKRVREAVERETRRLQTPWDVSSLKGDFAFNGSGSASRTAAAPAGQSGPSSDAQLAIEREFWVSVRDSNRADDIRAYLDKYPSGQFAALARNRIESIVRPGRSQVARAEPLDVPAPAPSAGLATAPGQAPGQALSPALTQPQAQPQAQPQTQPQAVQATLPATVAAPAAAGQSTPTTATPATTVVPANVATGGPAGSTGSARPVVGTAIPGSGAASPAAVPAAGPAITTASAAPASAASRQPPVDTQPGKEIAPGVREVQFPDGSIYRGGLRGTALHGAGEYLSKEGFKYRGDYLDGRMHGKGNFTFPNGDNFEGDFTDNSPNGRGVYKFKNGDSYIGEVKAGVITGRGLYTTRAGDQIDGHFADGKSLGKGIYKFSSGDRYEGDMVQGRLTGKGVYVSASGDRIEGDFIDGRPTGGVYRFTNGDRYEGEMKEGALTGRGVYFYSSGAKYEGDMVGGTPNGRGTFWFGDGSRFEGQFTDGMKRAKGHVIDKDGKKTDAEIIDGAVKWIAG